jgi:hypothetical protein
MRNEQHSEDDLGEGYLWGTAHRSCSLSQIGESSRRRRGLWLLSVVLLVDHDVIDATRWRHAEDWSSHVMINNVDRTNDRISHRGRRHLG